MQMKITVSWNSSIFFFDFSYIQFNRLLPLCLLFESSNLSLHWQKCLKYNIQFLEGSSEGNILYWYTSIYRQHKLYYNRFITVKISNCFKKKPRLRKEFLIPLLISRAVIEKSKSLSKQYIDFHTDFFSQCVITSMLKYYTHIYFIFYKTFQLCFHIAKSCDNIARVAKDFLSLSYNVYT